LGELHTTGRVRAIAALGLLVAGVAFAQRGRFGGFERMGAPQPSAAIPYDGRFAFVRLTYDTLPGG